RTGAALRPPVRRGPQGPRRALPARDLAAAGAQRRERLRRLPQDREDRVGPAHARGRGPRLPHAPARGLPPEGGRGQPPGAGHRPGPETPHAAAEVPALDRDRDENLARFCGGDPQEAAAVKALPRARARPLSWHGRESGTTRMALACPRSGWTKWRGRLG